MNTATAHAEPAATPPSQPEATTSPTRHGFACSGAYWLVPQGIYAELSPRPPICTIPDTPAVLQGYINQRGDTLPVFDLAQLVDTPLGAGGHWVLRLGKGAEAFGLLLASLPHAVTLSEQGATSTAQPPATLIDPLRQFAGAGYQGETATWWEFDHTQFCAFIRRQFNASG